MTRFNLVIFDCDGVPGGIAAGMIVFGYAELMKEGALRNAGAHDIFTTMESLLTPLASMNKISFAHLHIKLL